MKLLLRGANRSNYAGVNISNEKVSSNCTNGPKLKPTEQSTKPLRFVFSSPTFRILTHSLISVGIFFVT